MSVLLFARNHSVFANLSQSCRDDVTEETEAEEEK